MARQPRIDLAGVHHVINRGVNRSYIFITDEDYSVFMKHRGQVITITF